MILSDLVGAAWIVQPSEYSPIMALIVAVVLGAVCYWAYVTLE